ncbi:hypothetical protein HP397_06780, partial [Streptobacillus felis]
TNNNTKIENNKELNYKHLNYVDRVIIEHELKQVNMLNITKFVSNPTTSNKKFFCNVLKRIAKILNKSLKTIKREIKRGTVEQLDYMHNKILIYSKDTSNLRYTNSITNKKISLKIENNEDLIKDIVKLSEKYEINFTVQTLYNYINSSFFESYGYKKESNTIIYKSKGIKTHKKAVTKSGGLSIDKRAESINNREE